MGWPEYTWIALAVFGWLHEGAKHGEPKDGKHDMGIHTAALGLAIFLLWQGGFFQ